MAFLPVKLSVISRFFFFLILVVQASVLITFAVKHKNAYGFIGLAALYFIPLVYWIITLWRDTLKFRLSAVWFWYSCVLVVMMGVIFGRAVIEDDKLREHEIATCLCNVTSATSNATTTEHSFFDSKFLKITLCFTPGLMLLLLTSVTDEDGELKQLYFTTVLDLFDGIEMIEVLHEDVCDKIPLGWEIAVLVAALLFFLLSALELYQVEFENPEHDEKKKKKAKKTKSEETQKVSFRKGIVKMNAIFQVVLNLAFLFIRAVLWLHYDFDSAVFLAKNVISLVMVTIDLLEVGDYITTKSKSSDGGSTTKIKAETKEMKELGIRNLSQNYT